MSTSVNNNTTFKERLDSISNEDLAEEAVNVLKAIQQAISEILSGLKTNNDEKTIEILIITPADDDEKTPLSKDPAESIFEITKIMGDALKNLSNYLKK